MRSDQSPHVTRAPRRGWCAFILLGLLCSDRTAYAQDRIVLVGATLIDGTGAQPIPESRVTVVGGRFVCISGPSGCPSQSGDREVDLTGLWITPGLIDTHVHLDYELSREETVSRQALRFALGITTVRDAGSLQLDALLDQRAQATASTHPYPRIVAAERPAAPYDTRFGVPLGAPLVKRLAEMGVDAIKIKDHVSDDALLLEEIRAAAQLGLPVFGHTWRSPPPAGLTAEAIAAGLSGVSHLMAIEPATQPPEIDLTRGPREDDRSYDEWRKGLWLTASQEKLDALGALMIEHRVWLEPMLVTEYYWGLPLHPPERLSFLRQTPPMLRDIVRGRNELAAPIGPAFPKPYARMAAFVQDFHRQGGIVITGTDDVRPGLDLHEEIRRLREAGLSPLDSLRAATSHAAVALRRDDLGSIVPGKLADAVVYDSDPLGAPGDTLSVVRVIKGGHVYDSRQLLQPFQDAYDAQVRRVWERWVVRGLIGLVALAGLAFLALAVMKWSRRLA